MALNDTACSRHGDSINSVSGHYAFFVFWALTLAWFQRFRLGAVGAPLSAWRCVAVGVGARTMQLAATWLLLAFALSSAAVLAFTWLGGFHTLRQVSLVSAACLGGART